jgi:hypothetical protein
MRDEILEKGYPLIRRALEQAAAAEYAPEPAEVPVQTE